MSLNDYELGTLTGAGPDLSALAGQVVLVVNVASACGYTPQYTGLQALHEELAEDGFSVLGVPCNQFGAQEPGSAEEITSFCETNFGVSFPMSEKVEVNGEGAHPLFAWLTGDAAGHPGPVEWNFEKFLIGKDGKLLARYPSAVTLEDNGLRTDIANALSD